MTGPTSFAPIIETAIEIVDNSGGQYHILLIIADGQVSSFYFEVCRCNYYLLRV
jgi:E3 ubiquitin-protein ligase RGLG